MSIKNEWDRIGERSLAQTTEIEGVDAEIEFAPEDDGRWALRVWPHVPEDASEVPMPEQLEPLIGSKARIGNVYGDAFVDPAILIESCIVASLYARFDADKAEEIVEHARLKDGDDGSSS